MKILAGGRGLEGLGNRSTVKQALAKVAECQVDR
jgi:hypothetical protein